MTKTPEDAREQLCPQSYASGDGFSRCCADKCMAWRWWDEPSQAQRRGFCGMAGKPLMGDSR